MTSLNYKGRLFMLGLHFAVYWASRHLVPFLFAMDALLGVSLAFCRRMRSFALTAPNRDGTVRLGMSNLAAFRSGCHLCNKGSTDGYPQTLEVQRVQQYSSLKSDPEWGGLTEHFLSVNKFRSVQFFHFENLDTRRGVVMEWHLSVLKNIL